MNKIIFMNASFLAGIIVSIGVYIGLPKVLDPSNYALASPLAILISSTVALITAFISISNTNFHTRQKNTIDVVGQGKGEIGPEYLFITNFLKKNTGNERKALIYLARNNTSFSEMKPILTKLNELEHLCEGMFKGFYDEGIICNTRGSAVIRVWEKLRPYMLERRKIQEKRLSGHSKFLLSPENKPFYWLEKAHNKFTNDKSAYEKVVVLVVVSLFIIIIFVSPFALIYSVSS